MVIGSFGASYITFKKMFKIILAGTNPIIWTDVIKNWNAGLIAFISQKTLFKTRPIVGFIHALVPWGFTLYLLVNIIDVLYGFIPNFKFLPNSITGDIYRLFVDTFSILVLLGVFYFLARRFIIQEDRLTIKDPVLLSDRAKAGMKFDSFIVGAFIIIHIGSRFLSASFEIAIHGADWSQPAANIVATLWSTLSPNTLAIAEHVTWWLALGLILLFLPYFPYSKHAHLFMGPLNIMASEKRRSMAAIETIDFEDEELDQFGSSTNSAPSPNTTIRWLCLYTM